ncbi:ATPase AAA [Synergistales bacterium]|nr:ATPase AAA [Synergistales bacterium]
MMSMSKPQKLPIGIQTFEQIRNGDYLYVDKTKYLLNLIDGGKVYFLSRPRRFGKSLTISTFDAIFSGKRELFKGLAAEEYFDRSEYKPCPVIRLDMSQVTTEYGVEKTRSSILRVVREAADDLGVDIEDDMLPGEVLRYMIKQACIKHGLVAVLIDEYDKPYLDFMHKPDEAGEIRDTLRSLYIQIKTSDEYVKFAFITGISKFSKMGVFSGMNNLNDISMDARYAAMLGYTEEELVSNFAPHIDATAKGMGITSDELLERMRFYYDGFSFDGETMLYNPFSTLKFFNNPMFLNYWFETATPSYLARYMNDRQLTVEQFRGMGVSKDFAYAPGAIETSSPESFLYQSGYLTLRPGTVDDYSLDYPNQEVLTSMSKLLTANIFGDMGTTRESNTNLFTGLVHSDADMIVEEFNRLLASIPYDDYSRAAKAASRRGGVKMDAGEWLYRSTLLAYLRGSGVKVDGEVHTHRGRADIVVTHKGHVWVFELKIAHGDEDAAKLADDALKQIIDMGYADKYDNAIMMGLVIDDDKRSIAEYRVASGV